MTHFTQKRDPWGNSLAMWVLLAMFFAAPLGWLAIRQTRLENEVEKWLPENDTDLTVLRWAHQQFPIDERLFVTWDGSSLNDPRVDELIDRFMGRVDTDGIRRGGLPHVADVVDPRQLLTAMQKQEIEPHEAVRRLEGILIGSGSLKLRLTEFGKARLKRTRQELTAAARTRFGIELKFSEPVTDFVTLVSVPAPAPAEGAQPGEPTAPAVMSVEGTLLQGETSDHDLQVVWKGLRPGTARTREVADWLTQFVPPKSEEQRVVDRCFFVPGSPIAIALSISDAGVADKAETVEVIRNAAASVGIPEESLHLGGRAFAATEMNHEVLKSVWNKAYPWTSLHQRSIILTAVLVVVVLVQLMVRSVRLASMVLTVSLYSMFLTMAVIPVTGGSMNMIMSVIPTLVMVLTLAGALQVASHWKHAVHRDPAGAVAESARSAWLPTLLSCLTTAVGLLPLCLSSLAPLRELGLYSILGSVFSIVMVLVALPSMLTFWPGALPEVHEDDLAGWRMLGKGLSVWPSLQSVAVIALCVACGYGLKRAKTDANVMRFFPEKSRIAMDYQFYETQLGGVMSLESVVRFDARAQQDNSFIDRMEIVRDITERMRSVTEVTGVTSLPDYLPVNERLEPDAGIIAKGKFTKRSNSLQQQVQDGEIPTAKTHYRLSDRGHDLSIVGDNRLNEPGDELWRITAQMVVSPEGSVEPILTNVNQITQDILRRYPGSMHTLTGVAPLLLRSQNTALLGLVGRTTLVAILAFVLMATVLRSIPAGILTLIPLAAPQLVVIGLYAWMGHAIDLGTMIVAAVGFGIVADGILHFVATARRHMAAGMSRQTAVIETLVECGPARWQMCLATASGLLLLMSADVSLISRFGVLMAGMIGMSFVSQSIVLPQLMVGPLGWFFEPSAEKPLDEPGVRVEILDPALSEMIDAPASGAETLPAPHLRTLQPNREHHPQG